jgi:hypothetical protein
MNTSKNKDTILPGIIKMVKDDKLMEKMTKMHYIWITFL